MAILTLPWLAFVCVVAVACWWLVPARHRAAFLLAASLAYCLALGPWMAPVYLAVGAAVWALGQRLEEPTERRDEPQGDRRRRLRWLLVGLAALIGHWSLWKHGHILAAIPRRLELSSDAGTPIPGLADFAVPLGLSFLTFRCIHYLAERYRGGLPPARLRDFLGYLLFFPLFTVGPLERFGAFQRQTPSRPSLPEVNMAVGRVLVGVLKKQLISHPLGRFSYPVLVAAGEHERWMVAAAVYAAALQIYMDLSGYSDIAIGTSRLLGYRISENFRWPILRASIAEFWRHWHMTLYAFMRDYVFFPLLSLRWGRPGTWLAVVATTFLLRLWHDASLSFLLLGLYHVAGMLSWMALRGLKRRSARLAGAIDARWLTPLWVWLTFSFFSLGTVLFLTDTATFGSVLRRLVGV